MNMKKIFILFIILLVSFSLFPQDNSSESGLIKTLKNNIGKEVTVTILFLEVTIAGTLNQVYNDSIIIKSFNKDVIIPIQAVAFVKIK